MLPVSLVQPVIVKNTFLDFDDSCMKRVYRRCKTEGEINVEPDVELYDQQRRRSHAAEGVVDMKSCIDFGSHSDDETSTCSSSSSADRASSNNSHTSESQGAEDVMLSVLPQQKLEESWRPALPFSEATVPGVEASTGACSTDATVHSWKLDSKKLRSNDRAVVSRPFTLAIGGPISEGLTCKMMLYAKGFNTGRAGQSFRSSGGQGSLQLKCDCGISTFMRGQVSLRFSIGNGHLFKVVEHDFSQSAACESSDWDFVEAVDRRTQTLVVSVEVLTA